MANNCMNWVNIWGKDTTLKRINDRLEKYTDHKGSFLEWGDIVVNKKLEEGEEDEREHYHYGTRWWDFEVQKEKGQLNICGDSAWSPPTELIKQICIEYKVTATIEYEEPGFDFGGKTEFDELGEIVEEIKMTYDEWRYHDSDKEYVYNILQDLEDFYDTYEDEDSLIKNYKFLSEEHKKELLIEYNKLKL
jgi:hypothetical protein